MPWLVKDYADGWITFQRGEDALCEVEQMGEALVRFAPDAEPSAVVHADDCQSHIVDVRGRPDDCTCGADGWVPLTAQMARAQADMWQEASARALAAEATIRELLEALKTLHLKTVVGTDQERHDALNAAWAAIAKAEAA